MWFLGSMWLDCHLLIFHLQNFMGKTLACTNYREYTYMSHVLYLTLWRALCCGNGFHGDSFMKCLSMGSLETSFEIMVARQQWNFWMSWKYLPCRERYRIVISGLFGNSFHGNEKFMKWNVNVYKMFISGLCGTVSIITVARQHWNFWIFYKLLSCW